MTRRDAYEVTGDAFVSERTRKRERGRERGGERERERERENSFKIDHFERLTRLHLRSRSFHIEFSNCIQRYGCELQCDRGNEEGRARAKSMRCSL